MQGFLGWPTSPQPDLYRGKCSPQCVHLIQTVQVSLSRKNDCLRTAGDTPAGQPDWHIPASPPTQPCRPASLLYPPSPLDVLWSVSLLFSLYPTPPSGFLPCSLVQLDLMAPELLSKGGLTLTLCEHGDIQTHIHSRAGEVRFWVSISCLRRWEHHEVVWFPACAERSSRKRSSGSEFISGALYVTGKFQVCSGRNPCLPWPVSHLSGG